MRVHATNAELIFYVSGAATFVPHAERRDRLARQFVAEPETFGVAPPPPADALFGFD